MGTLIFFILTITPVQEPDATPITGIMSESSLNILTESGNPILIDP
jgi:hypothetical protein